MRILLIAVLATVTTVGASESKPAHRHEIEQVKAFSRLYGVLRLAGTIVFLTDGRAISYAESVMGYVGDRKLGTIVGGPTAGTNGNVASFVVPSGLTVSFTGMRVTRHDGSTAHHLVGVKPDIHVEMSVAGLRSGHDEVLERAVSLIRATIR